MQSVLLLLQCTVLREFSGHDAERTNISRGHWNPEIEGTEPKGIETWRAQRRSVHRVWSSWGENTRMERITERDRQGDSRGLKKVPLGNQPSTVKCLRVRKVTEARERRAIKDQRKEYLQFSTGLRSHNQSRKPDLPWAMTVLSAGYMLTICHSSGMWALRRPSACMFYSLLYAQCQA